MKLKYILLKLIFLYLSSVRTISLQDSVQNCEWVYSPEKITSRYDCFITIVNEDNVFLNYSDNYIQITKEQVKKLIITNDLRIPLVN